MVLQTNFAQRSAENAPPVSNSAAKSLVAKIRTTLNDPSRRRRGRTSGTRSQKYMVEQAKRRSTTKSPANSIKYKLRTVVNSTSSTPDVEMQDAEPLASSSRTVKMVDVSIVRELVRPEYREVVPEAISAVDPELAKDFNIEFVRDVLKDVGPSLLQSLSAAKPSERITNALPKELAMIVQDPNLAPTHMMAVHNGRRAAEPEGKKSKVTLFAVHSIILAAYCSKLPPFLPSPALSPSGKESGIEIKVPVRSLSLPCPEMYPNLMSFLYTKRSSTLLNSLLPCPIPPNFEEDQVAQLRPFAAKLGETYTIQLLLTRMRQVHGLWQNVCALGIFDDDLWDTMDLAWDIYLHALAVGTRRPDLFSTPSQPQPVSSSQEPSTQPSNSSS